MSDATVEVVKEYTDPEEIKCDACGAVIPPEEDGSVTVSPGGVWNACAHCRADIVALFPEPTTRYVEGDPVYGDPEADFDPPEGEDASS